MIPTSPYSLRNSLSKKSQKAHTPSSTRYKRSDIPAEIHLHSKCNRWAASAGKLSSTMNTILAFGFAVLILPRIKNIKKSVKISILAPFRHPMGNVTSEHTSRRLTRAQVRSSCSEYGIKPIPVTAPFSMVHR
eukprot:Gregarina_sp_Pseudo_9__5622@NODE_777_length_2230_cov_10_497033_g732_i0_p3_GENE_NODE_777_length_2230_cov_10_497033_g732_i0NODE_777_length_2230_cov_10_497033_g732_i0_p3_ORF_typecomplete_len133_score2_01LEM/PF03020_15/0_083_NODE_777_length_2230_cov_10_497033_g732_i0213611